MMDSQNFSSKLLKEAVDEFAKLPGIGRKTALRFVLHLLKQDIEEVTNFGNILTKLRSEIIYCKECHNISDKEICNICANPSRDHSLVCVVENLKDVISIESTHQFFGVYHVLGGIISPMDGIGPADLNISSFEDKVKNGNVKEVILALSTTMEGDATNYYLYKIINNYPVDVSILARGVPIGDELEYADEITLGRSIINRTPFEPVMI